MDALIYLLVIYLVLHTGGSSATSQTPLHFPFPNVGVTVETDGPRFLDGGWGGENLRKFS